jgi:hypothetical protein
MDCLSQESLKWALTHGLNALGPSGRFRVLLERVAEILVEFLKTEAQKDVVIREDSCSHGKKQSDPPPSEKMIVPGLPGATKRGANASRYKIEKSLI